jgi:Ca-activated chloride channel family protein
MKRSLLALATLLAFVGMSHARGILIPVEKSIPPLAMLSHKVNVTIEDQVAVTKLEQTFRNHTSRPLEATYIFPVPKGASVREFAMWVGGNRVKGELLTAKEAKKIYNDIIRQTQDPGLLEYIGNDLLSMKVFPVPAKGDQKVELSFTSVAKKDNEIVEYVYPLKTDGKSTNTLEEFSMNITLKSQHPIINIYSPTHAIGVTRANDKQATVTFEKQQAILDKDFTFYYTTGGKDVGLTVLQHRPISTEDGFVMMLISPRHEIAKDQQVPRDMVFVIDTSGSMRDDNKMEQAKKALKHCIDGLNPKDRFGLINFATTVNRYKDGLTVVDKEQITEAKKWVDRLEPTGGTAINAALLSALEMRSTDANRTFTVVFFTDGKPTIGETNTDKIMADVLKQNTANTRIFTFGVGHDLNAVFLDQVAEKTRAISSYVRPEEDIEVKVSSFFTKINHPVLANLKLTTNGNTRLVEVYPPNLPDLFLGDQLVVLARYQGAGPAAITLTGSVGAETKEFVYETDFQTKTGDKTFVEDLWARRKVGYLLDQIRINGEKKELVDEVTALAKKYGITTPYTSFLIVPDAPVPVVGRRTGTPVPEPKAAAAAELPPALQPQQGQTTTASNVTAFAKDVQSRMGGVTSGRGSWSDNEFKNLPSPAQYDPKDPNYERLRQLDQARATKEGQDLARYNLQNGRGGENHINRLGVDLSCYNNALKCQTRLQFSAYRKVADRRCMEIGGIWIDEDYKPTTPTVTVKAMSEAYFQILEKHPEVREVFQLGNHIVWVTPSGTALAIDTRDGQEKLTAEEINMLFKKQ